MRNCAFFQGRFQPVSIGHAAALAVILEQWQRVILGVVYDSPRPAHVDPRFTAYLDAVDVESYGPFRNPFEPLEMLQMWQAHLAAEKLSNRVDCRLVKRLEFEQEFNAKYPPSEIDLVWPKLSAHDAATDVWRHKLYPSVLARPIFYVGPVLKLHNASIREQIKAGADWSKFIPAGAHDVFREIDGPARMLEAIARRNT